MAFRSALTTMAETVATLLQQTAGTKDAIYHSVKWLLTPLKDISFPNPHFMPPATAVTALQSGVTLCCVHGTADNVMAFDDVARFLQDKLPTAIKSVELFSFEERGKGVGINNYARQTVTKLKAKDCRAVIFAGHSRGGLVVRKAAELAQEEGITVLLCFSICAPHGGSSLALPPLTWVSSSINEMQKGSDYLEKEMTTLPDPEIHLSAGAACDSIVSPEDAVLPGAPYRIFPNQGHLSIMHDPEMFKYFLEHIRRRVRQFFPPATSGLSPEEEKAEEISYETVVNSPLMAKLLDIYYELTLFREDWWHRAEFLLFPEKKAVLDELQQMVMALMSEPGVVAYPAAKTVGEFLAAFLDDKAGRELTRLAVLEQTYRYPASFFVTAGVVGRQLVERLKVVYGEVALVDKLMSEEIKADTLSPKQ